MNERAGENEALIAFARERMQPPAVQVLKHDGLEVPILVDHNGEYESIATLVDSERTRPRRIVGVATHTTQDSFEEHARRFKTEKSTLWAEVGPSPRLLSVLNYHGKDPEFGDHRGVYSFPLSKEWQAWVGNGGKWQSQVGFAEFIEDNLMDVVHFSNEAITDYHRAIVEAMELTVATPGEVLKLSRGLRVYVQHEIEDVANLSSGEGELTFKIEHRDKAGGKLRVPQCFFVHIPVFRAGEYATVLMLLRYRADGGAVKWRVDPYRADQVLEDQVTSAAEAAKEATGMQLFFGSPESPRSA